MKGFKHLINRPELNIFLFCFSVILLTWPLLSAIADTSQETVFVYFFLVWGIIILILFLTRKSDNEPPSPLDKRRSVGEDKDV
jgi:uncharacterized membrane protein